MSEKRIRLYEVFEGPKGLSAQTIDYHGELYMVAAVSIRQAYWLIGHRQWATDPDRPIGIIEHYTKNGPPEGWWRLWDGCRIHGGLALNHGNSRTKITRAMTAHLAKTHTSESAGGR